MIRQVLLLLLMLVTVQAQEPIKAVSWYDVESWEVSACQVWGGRSSAADSVAEFGRSPYGDATMTIQARRVRRYDGEFLYEAAYYLESLSNTRYSVDLVDPSRQNVLTLASGELAAGGGMTDFKVFYSNESFTQVRLVHDGGVVVAPVVEVR